MARDCLGTMMSDNKKADLRRLFYWAKAQLTSSVLLWSSCPCQQEPSRQQQEPLRQQQEPQVQQVQQQEPQVQQVQQQEFQLAFHRKR